MKVMYRLLKVSLLALLSTAILLAIQSQATAVSGNVSTTAPLTPERMLINILGECQNVDSINGACKYYEDQLRAGDNEAIGCGDLYYSKEVQKSYAPKADPQNTVKKWYIDAADFAGCFNMVKSKIRKVEKQCDIDLVRGNGSWDSCENMQNRLKEAVGNSCDKLFKNTTDSDHFQLNKDQLNTCSNTLVTIVKNAKIEGAPPDNNYAKISDSGSVTVYDKTGKKVKTLDPSDPSAASSSTSDDDTDSNCSGGPMGWLFCPMIEYMANTINAIAGIIDSLMQVRFMSSEGPVAQIEKGWRTFLSFANIMLVIAFLVIIFSQATQAGLSNYNVKRMLPRLVIAAILMNISFYFCALLIDISNIVGSSVMGLFIGGDNSISSSIGDITNDGGGGLLGGVGAVAAAATLIGILIFVLPFVLLSIVGVFVMLIGRQVVLMCLILVSSLAFVAWLLPNTEQYFQKWWKLFFQLLVVYPMIMLVFGASLYLSNLLGSDAGVSVVAGESDTLRKLVQLIILMIPIFALPGLLKGSSAIMGRISGAADNVSRQIGVEKAGNAVKGGVGGAMKRSALNTEARMATRDGALGGIGRYRYARNKKRENSEALRKRIQDEAYFDQRSGTQHDNKTAAEKSIPRSLRNTEAGRAFVGRIGAVGSRAALDEALDLENKKIQVDFAPGDVGGLLRELDSTLTAGDAVRSQALFKRLNSEGKGAVAQAGDLMVDHSIRGTFRDNPELGRAVAEQRQADWNTVKGADPVLASLNLDTGQSTPSVAPTDLQTMAGPRLQQLAASGVITREIVGEAASKGHLGNLEGGRRDQLEQGLGDTVENTRVDYESKPFNRNPNP